VNYFVTQRDQSSELAPAINEVDFAARWVSFPDRRSRELPS
jgi:hypothetical protein